MSSAAAVPVVITGLGTVTAAGCGRDALAAQLAAGQPRLREVDRSAGFHRPRGARLAALVEATSFEPWLPPLAARRMGRPSRFAVVAAKLALADAGLEDAGLAEIPAAVVLGTAFGPAEFSERIVRTLLAEGPEATSPALFTESVANAPAAQVALALAARGPNLTITQREASPLLALATAAREVASGRSEVALAGGVDEINPLLHAVLDRFGALASGRGRGGGETARPFDRRRDGFLAAEGAAVVVLESEPRARARGARVLARLGPAVAGFDPSAPVSGWPARPETLARRLALGLERAGIGPGSIDRIVAGGSGARGGDRLEAQVLRSAWDGAPLPPVLAPKGVTGEYGGGLLAAAVLAARAAPFGPTAGFEQSDPELGLAPHDGRQLAPPSRLLAGSLAAGGAAAWVILEAAA